MAGFQEVKAEVLDELHVQRKTQNLNVPAVMGPPGIGKSALAEDVSIEMGTTYYPINVGDNGDPTDVTGTPVPVGLLRERTLLVPESTQTEAVEEYVRRALGRRDAEEKIEKIVWALNRGAYMAVTGPTLLLHDDFDKASDIVMKSLIGLFGTRSFRDYPLHPLSLLMCAGNRVGDDILSGDISQSILGRVTPIEMEASVDDFAAYAEQSGDIDGDILGFVLANPDMLYQVPAEGAYASPSPRSWWQASKHFDHVGAQPIDSLARSEWKNRRARIVERKCGVGMKNSWLVWENILSKVDVPRLLETGPLPLPIGDNMRAFRYACVFATSRYIHNHKPSAKWVGLGPFIDSLEDEFKLAFLVQINSKHRSALTKLFPGLGSKLIGKLIVGDDDEDDED